MNELLDDIEKELKNIYEEEKVLIRELGLRRVDVRRFIHLCHTLILLENLKLMTQTKWIAKMGADSSNLLKL